jgi:hypothetical protein
MKYQKLYIVGHRRFTSEKSMKNYLLRVNENVRKNIKILIYNLESEMTGDFIDQEIISNKRDLQLSGLLGDNNILQIIEPIKSKIEEIKPTNKYYNWEGDIILNKLSIINDQKSLSDVVGDHGAFLFRLDNGIDWYKSLLRARSFREIPMGVYKRIWDTVSRRYIIEKNEDDIANFNKAKLEINYEKKRNKKTISSTK